MIIHGLKEPSAAEAEDRKTEDQEQIISLLHHIKCDKISVASVVRLGRVTDDEEGGKPRPIKLVLASEEQEIVLRQAKNLRGSGVWDRVFIHQDQTPKQRMKRQQLVQEIKEREKNGEKNLIIVGGKIVVRRQRTVQMVSGSGASTPMQTASLAS